MLPLPHDYSVTASARPAGDILISSGDAPALPTAAPVEFDGPGRRWSPEQLLVAAAVDCFVLTFQGLARRSRLAFISIACDGTGTLDRVDGYMAFTDLTLFARVLLPDGASLHLTERLLHKAEETCLITRSMTARVSLQFELMTNDMASAGAA